MTTLAVGWTVKSVGDLVELNPKNACDDQIVVGFVPMPLLGTTYLSSISFEEKRWSQVRKGYTHFADGDVLLAKITPCFENGKAGIARGLPNGLGAGSTEYFVCRTRPEVLEARYLLAWFKTESFLRNGAVEMTGSVGHKRVPKEYVISSRIPLAPLREQQRIADKLDTVLARVDACRDRLHRIDPLIERFRQSVLAAATSGRLTEDWRRENPSPSSSDSLLESDARAKQLMLLRQPELKKKKSSLNSGIAEDYVFPVPESWRFTTWGTVSEWITYGFTRPMPSTAEGCRLLTAKDVHPFNLRLYDSGFTAAEAFAALSEKDRPRRGDLLITKDGSIGRAAIVDTDEPFCINQSVAVCWLRSTSMDRKYLEIVANAKFTQDFVQEKAKGMAIQHLSITDFAQCPLPVPPLAEQLAIVQRVDRLFAFADRLEEQLSKAKNAASSLTPALLAKAFRGELVPQDPNDEPAEELLKRFQNDQVQVINVVKVPRPRRLSAVPRERDSEITAA